MRTYPLLVTLKLNVDGDEYSMINNPSDSYTIESAILLSLESGDGNLEILALGDLYTADSNENP